MKNMKKKLSKYSLFLSSVFCLTACATTLLGTVVVGTALYGTSSNWTTTDKEHQEIMNCLDKALVKLNIYFENDEEKYKNKTVMDIYYQCIKNPNYVVTHNNL
ncbi:TPA: hypothetical protein WI610_001802 [Neisseria meningitidis]|jgi:hypothetical protein|nr:hypothetical protein [Neisseria meningitidis]ADZ00167.1 hypothetical protein NMBM01240355_1680 [Neisseria meningitidis M01-240355]ADZ02131.1 hypothetical protein NMBM04240196_1700 [Neisseria meningitidis M04-240196]EJU54928.1 hypothetical protein NMEN93004_1155 [Neisseria meningitidis 93004]ELK57234.1 hypothetical protein NMNM422_1796 [Neisseria meningitidis NM422]ELK77486.1 hypothetical protein NMM13255_1759 [Neisseria meningitidis M13255]